MKMQKHKREAAGKSAASYAMMGTGFWRVNKIPRSSKAVPLPAKET